MDADTNLNMALCSAATRKNLLDSYRTAHRFDGTRKLRQHAVTSRIGYPSAVLADLVLYSSSDAAESSQRSRLIGLDQP
jgi:hypothetical protein